MPISFFPFGWEGGGTAEAEVCKDLAIRISNIINQCCNISFLCWIMSFRARNVIFVKEKNKNKDMQKKGRKGNEQYNIET